MPETRNKLRLLLAILCALQPIIALAQPQPGTLDTSFNSQSILNSWANAVLVRSDGNILVAGAFSSSYVNLLLPSGGAASGFSAAATQPIDAMAVQTDGKVLIAGEFGNVNSVARHFIARLTTSGSLDTSFDPQTGPDNYVFALALQTDGKILIGGSFTSYAGNSVPRIARLNADGSLDSTFAPGSGANDEVYAIWLQPDGKVVIAGRFTSVNGTARYRLARLNSNGSLDAGFNNGTGASATVRGVVGRSDGKLLIVGDFATYNGTSVPAVARLNTDGTLDSSFNSPLAGVTLKSIALQSDGKVVVAGDTVRRLNSDGSQDTTFATLSAAPLVNTLAIQTDGKILLGGSFIQVGGVSRLFLARLYGGNAVAPTILAQPQPQTVSVGQTATFSVTASGTQTLAYRWRKNGSIISGATSSSYSVVNVQASDVGSYDVEVSNSAGTGISQTAALTINSPIITSQPFNQTVFAGQSVSFSVSVSGSTPFTYQWQKNSVNIGGATTSSYTINIAQATHVGSYRVIVNNSFGSVTSDTATLTLNSPVQPSFTLQPQSQTVNVGQTVTFSATATGNPSPSYQWRKNGVNISGATASSYTVSNAQLTDAGTYDVVASNLGGSAASSGATLAVNGPPIITAQPANQTVVAGTTINLSVMASGTNPLTYQWRRYGTNLPGATSASLVLNAALPGDSGYYSVAITNPNGTTTSAIATINVLPVGASPNRVLSLDGSSGIVTIPSAADLQSPDAFTLEAWLFPSAFGSNTSGQFINKSDGQSVASARSYEVTWKPDGHVVLQVFLNATTWALIAAPAAQDQWVHVAATYDSSLGLLQLYTNGLLAASTTRDAGGQTLLVGQRIRQTSLPLVFGVLPGNGSSYVNGQMDEVQIWSRVRTAAEIAGSMFCRLVGTEPGLAGYWTFDDGTATDLTGHGYNGVLTGNATTPLLLGADPLHTTNQTPCITSQPQNITVGIGQNASFAVTVVAGTNLGPFSYQWRKDGTNLIGATSATLVLSAEQSGESGNYSVAVSNQFGAVTSTTATSTVVNRVLSLDGNSGIVTIPSAADLQNSDAFTIEGWFYPIANAANTHPLFINKGDGQTGGSSRSYEVQWQPDVGFAVAVFLGTSTYASLTTPAPLSQWTHIALTYDSNRELICLYRNGILTASSTNTDAGRPLNGLKMRQTTLPLVFGMIPGGPPTHATGYMDEVRIWSRVRTPEEIAGSMFCRLAGTEPGLAGYWTFDDGTARDTTGHGHDGVISGNASATDLLGSDPLHSTNRAPCITTQTQPQLAVTGSNVSWLVTAVGGAPIAYQWQRNGLSLLGATNSTLTLTNLTRQQDAGAYSVILSNAYGITTSVSALLSVMVSQRMEQPERLQDGSVRLLFGDFDNASLTEAETNHLFVQWSTNLSAWMDLTNTIRSIINGKVSLDDALPPNESRRYYRVITR